MSAYRTHFFAAGVLLILCHRSWGVSRTFVGSMSGDPTDWYQANNWDPPGIPDPADAATVSGRLVSINGPTLVPGLDISGGGSVLLTQGSMFQANVAAIVLGLFRPGTGTLTLDEGSVLEVFNRDPDTGILYGSRMELGYARSGILTVEDESRITAATMDMFVGSGSEFGDTLATGEVYVRSRGLIESSMVVLGDHSNAQGEGTVSGVGSLWRSNGGFIVGRAGEGDFNLRTGGLASSATVTLGDETSGVGRMAVRSGAELSARDIVVGQAGVGTLTVANGGKVRPSDVNPGTLTIAAEIGSQGVVTVRDPGSQINQRTPGGNFAQLAVGLLGDGELNVLAGGSVLSGNVMVGSVLNEKGTVRIVGTDSELSYDEDLSLHNGTVRVEGGAKLQGTGHDPFTNIDSIGGLGNFMVGEVIVRGAGSRWEGPAGGIRVGTGLGSGIVDVLAGGHISSAESMIAPQSDAEGQVTVSGSGSEWSISDSLYVGGTSATPGGEASLTIANSAKVDVAQSMKIWGDGTVSLGKTGQLTVNGQTVTVANGAQYYAEPGAKIEMLGTNLEIESTNPQDVAGLADTSFLFAGGDAVVDSVEVAGLDHGQAWSAFAQNFTLGRLQIGTSDEASHVRLADTLANRGGPGSEVLYVRHVEVGPGSSLDLDGLTLYVLEYDNHGGDLIPGSTGQLIEVGALSQIESEPLTATYFISPDAIDTAILTLAGQADVHLESALQQQSSPAANVYLSGLLQDDLSADGDAVGVFADVAVDVVDALGNVLVRGNIVELLLQEDSDPANGLIGTGVLDVSESVLAEGFALGYGGRLAVEVRISGVDVNDFSANFEGGATVIVMPLPEPTSSFLACIALILSIVPRIRPARSWWADIGL